MIRRLRSLLRALAGLLLLALAWRAVRALPWGRIGRGRRQLKSGPELVVAGLLAAATVPALAFVVVYAVDALGHQTQWLGVTLALAFALIAAAAILMARSVLPSEEIAHDYPELDREYDQEAVVETVAESESAITRGRLLATCAGGAGLVLGAALATPALSLGPVLDTSSLRASPWRRHVHLVDENGTRIHADDVEFNAILTAYPQGAPREQIGAPLVVARLALHQITPERRSWSPRGIVAFSKICTHAGCAISLYRAPLSEPTSPQRALVCPCHYSVFDPADAGAVLSGPAGRPLPQLPLMLAGDGTLVAAGPFSGMPGPSWWGVRE